MDSREIEVSPELRPSASEPDSDASRGARLRSAPAAVLGEPAHPRTLRFVARLWADLRSGILRVGDDEARLVRGEPADASSAAAIHRLVRSPWVAFDPENGPEDVERPAVLGALLLADARTVGAKVPTRFSSGPLASASPGLPLSRGVRRLMSSLQELPSIAAPRDPEARAELGALVALGAIRPEAGDSLSDFAGTSVVIEGGVLDSAVHPALRPVAEAAAPPPGEGLVGLVEERLSQAERGGACLALGLPAGTGGAAVARAARQELEDLRFFAASEEVPKECLGLLDAWTSLLEAWQLDPSAGTEFSEASPGRLSLDEGRWLLRHGRPAQARRWLEQACLLAPGVAEGHVWLGCALILDARVGLRGKENLAIPALQKACKLAPADPAPRFALAWAYAMLARPTEARMELAGLDAEAARQPAVRMLAVILAGRAAPGATGLLERSAQLHALLLLGPGLVEPAS